MPALCFVHACMYAHVLGAPPAAEQRECRGGYECGLTHNTTVRVRAHGMSGEEVLTSSLKRTCTPFTATQAQVAQVHEPKQQHALSG